LLNYHYQKIIMKKEYNMKDRIQINGEWYVREQSDPVTEPEFELNIDNIIHTKGMLYESDKYYFEAIKMRQRGSDDEYYDCDIVFKDKRTKPWVEEYWDNIFWFRGVLDNNPESLEHLKESVCPQGEAEFKAFLKILKQQGWL
jgi:hypothetical protein